MNATKPFIRHLAAVLSYLFHPVFMPLALILILLFSRTYVSYLPPAIKSFDLILIVLNTILIPLMFMFVLQRVGYIKSFFLDNRKERYVPLSLYMIFVFITFLVLKKVHQPVIVYDLFLGMTVTAFLALMVSFRWKISLHLTGLGGVSGFLFVAFYRLGQNVFMTWWLVSLVLAGFLATARLIRGHHTPAEVYAGFLLGFSSITGVMLFF
ncbi:MAG: hypothetical protein J7K46_08080 [Bacteroidales bacterium]|nr:hypothetical protein [Bacteroidales bacterium]